MPAIWLPEGGAHGLNIRHHRLEDAGPFTGGGWKLVPHTTESPRSATRAMVQVLDDKRAAPHLVIGTDPDHMKFPLVYQLIPFNRAGRSLEHTFKPETNRANAIQIEICGFTRDCHRWEDNWLKALANLWRMVHLAVPGIPLWNPRSFQPPVKKLTPDGWVKAKGVVGHVHCPGNTHTDPTGLRARYICRLAKSGWQDLKPFN